MANVFTKQTDVVNKPRRNVFDLSHANNLTMHFGALTPCYCEEVIPGDSFQIETRMALKLMPMVFPVQTDMRAYVHFFYVRNRNLWKDWQNFIGMLPQGYTEQQMQKYELPYLRFGKSPVGNGDLFPRTGSLYDYMGMPTTEVGRYGNENDLTFTQNFSYYGFTSESKDYYQMPQAKIGQSVFTSYYNLGVGSMNGLNINSILDTSIIGDFNKVPTTDYDKDHSTTVLWTVSNPVNFGGDEYVTEIVDGVETIALTFKTFEISSTVPSVASRFIFIGVDDDNIIQFSTPYGNVVGGASDPSLCPTINVAKSLLSSVKRIYILGFYSTANAVLVSSDNQFSDYLFNVVTARLSGVSFVDDLTESASPYYRDGFTDKALKISALPFRAYESVYNAFYRDPRNNPYLLNGSPEYNKWCPSVEGGPDKNNYPLHYRNWEADFLTTALPSPQQGEAPLVGITNSGKLAFIDETGTTYRADLEFNEDNSGLKGINVQASNEPVGTMTRIVDFATSGISIADLRGVNALQRWLEINARRGYRYKDQIKSHFDVDIRFDELDMPEFLGGCSADIYVNQISQTVNQSDSGQWQDTLGAYGGQGFTRLEKSRPIRHYFDEHGYIIGIISVVPVPCYSQLLPKHFLKRNPLDFYFPEFSKLGMQPITYSEVCPIQTYNSSDGADGMQDTFGYQRAWYEYLQRVDEVHGEFRLSMRNFLINRVFNERPELSEDFLTVNPDQVNQVFAVTQMSDKIFGQLYFKVTAKRPIPEYGIPALE